MKSKVNLSKSGKQINPPVKQEEGKPLLTLAQKQIIQQNYLLKKLYTNCRQWR